MADPERSSVGGMGHLALSPRKPLEVRAANALRVEWCPWGLMARGINETRTTSSILGALGLVSC
jgi:hypothetical protein